MSPRLTPNVAANRATKSDDRRCHLSLLRRENSSTDACDNLVSEPRKERSACLESAEDVL